MVRVRHRTFSRVLQVIWMHYRFKEQVAWRCGLNIVFPDAGSGWKMLLVCFNCRVSCIVQIWLFWLFWHLTTQTHINAIRVSYEIGTLVLCLFCTPMKAIHHKHRQKLNEVCTAVGQIRTRKRCCLNNLPGSGAYRYLEPCDRAKMISGILDLYCSGILTCLNVLAGIILCMRPANERHCYSVTPVLIGWAHTKNGPCPMPLILYVCNTSQ